MKLFSTSSLTIFSFSLVLLFVSGQVRAGISLMPLAEISVSGSPGAVASGDIDGDGQVDLSVIVAKLDGTVSLLILWGSGMSWTERKSIPLGLVMASGSPTMRDTGTQTVVIADFNGDNLLDIGTSEGLAMNLGAREFKWVAFASVDGISPTPIGILRQGSNTKLLRGAINGVDTCDLSGCRSLARLENLNGNQGGRVNSLVVTDFDGDGEDDLMAGSLYSDPYSSYLWLAKDNYEAPLQLMDVHAVDIQVGDVNGDGRPDVVAQRREVISDFPSQTDVFLNLPEGLRKIQTFYNFDNHSENAVLVNRPGAPCPDYFQIGVDVGFALRRGEKDEFGRCNDLGSGAVWTQISDQTGIGIQCLRVKPGKDCQLVVRKSDAITRGKITLFTYPIL